MVDSRLLRGISGQIPLLFIVLILYLHLALPEKLDERFIFEPYLLTFLLNTVFIFFSSFAVAYLAGRSFVRGGNPSLFFLGIGALAIGLANAISSWLARPSGENLVVTVHNCGVLLAALFHFAGAVFASSGIPLGRRPQRKAYLLLAYAAVTSVFLLLVVFSEKFFPPFFSRGIGPSPLRQMVLGSAILLFSATGFIFLGIYHRTRTAFLYWYSLALILYATGLMGIFLQRAFGGPIGWAGRTAQFLAGVYFFLAVFHAFIKARNRRAFGEMVLSDIFGRPLELYTTLVKTTTDAVIVINEEDRVLVWNPAAEKMFGYSADEAMGVPLFRLIAPGQTIGREGPEIGLGKKPPEERRSLEFEAVSRSGQRFPVEISISRARISEQPICTLILRDITERKRMEDELRKSEENYRNIIRYAPTFIYQVDFRGPRFTSVNDMMCEYIGYTREELLSLNPLDLMCDESRELFQARIGKWLEGEKPGESVECRVKARDGRELCVMLHVTFTTDKDGKPLGATVIGHDVTERKRAEEEMRRSRDELEQRVKERTAELELKNQELQEFSFVASHDLTEPLRKIKTFGNLLSEKCADRLKNEEKDYVSRMTGAADRMQELLDALLRYSRIETRGHEFRPLKLADIARDAANDLEVVLQEIGARVEIGPLPTVKGDRNQLRQFFQNLISNAVKYHRLEVRTVIKIYGEEKDGWCRIFVEDNGIGFDEKYLEKIFQPFQRLHGRKEYPGTGMGLAICKKIVDRHGGTLTAKSVKGKGSTFIMTLPGN